MSIPVEFWKKHPDIEKIEVSSFGRVRSVKGHYYKSLLDSHGYLQVGFRVNGKHVSRFVHRLVAQAFIPNPNNLPQVNHKDCDRYAAALPDDMPVIPEAVGEWIKDAKARYYDMLEAMTKWTLDQPVFDWIHDNSDTFARAWL